MAGRFEGLTDAEREMFRNILNSLLYILIARCRQ